jgi:cytochrome c oxidase subunit 2
VTSTELVLEQGRPTRFDIYSRLHDVIHSFYVPQFRVKADAVPGQVNHTYATPTRVGTYSLICTELCGPGHSLMRAPVRVLSQKDFDQWLAQQKSQQSSTQGGA